MERVTGLKSGQKPAILTHMIPLSERKPLAQRIAENQASNPDGCWEWHGVRSLGYGHISVMENGRPVKRKVHRVAYKLVVGPIPEGMHLDHLCRNPPCYNPKHLEAVTARTNILRGIGVAPRNAAKTHCKHGHEFTAENIKWQHKNGKNYRTCRACRNASARAAWPGAWERRKARGKTGNRRD